MTAHLVAAFREDIRMRTEGLEHANRTGYQVNAHEIRPGLIYADSNIRVTAFLVEHGSWLEAYGFRFEPPIARSSSPATRARPMPSGRPATGATFWCTRSTRR